MTEATTLFPTSKKVQVIISWVIPILVPIALILTAVRLLLTPTFVYLEYRTPNFPPDPYGFTQQDRMKWSLIALEYLLNDAGIEFLGDLKFEDETPVYNARELRHMVDVKVVVQAALNIWLLSVASLIGIGVWAWRGGWLDPFWTALGRGGWTAVGLIGATLVLVLIAFGVFFVAFHEVFFDPGTWTFLFTDTLIRLFPERFWRDTFLAVGLLTLVQAFILIYWSGKK